MKYLVRIILFTYIILHPTLVAFDIHLGRYLSTVWLLPFVCLLNPNNTKILKLFKPPKELFLLWGILLLVIVCHKGSLGLLLNTGQYIVATYSIYFSIKYYANKELLFENIAKTIIILFVAAIVISPLLTFFQVPNGPEYFIWECDGNMKRFRLMNMSGMHYASTLSSITILCSLFYFIKKVKNWSIICFPIFFFSVVVIYLNGSRIGVLFVLIVIFSLLFRRIKMIYLFSCLLLSAVVIYVAVVNNNVYEKIFAILTSASAILPFRFYTDVETNLGFLSGRELLFASLLEMIKDKPWIGHGYFIPFFDYGIPAVYENGKLVELKQTGTSESGFLFTARYGIVATVFYLFFMFKPIFNKRKKHLFLIIDLSIIFILINFAFNNSLFVSYNVSFLVFYFILACYAENNFRETTNTTFTTTPSRY